LSTATIPTWQIPVTPGKLKYAISPGSGSATCASIQASFFLNAAAPAGV